MAPDLELALQQLELAERLCEEAIEFMAEQLRVDGAPVTAGEARIRRLRVLQRKLRHVQATIRTAQTTLSDSRQD